MIKFNVGISAVQAGQKNNAANAEPRLIANSTAGKFQINGAVSKALNIAVGEYIKFFNNVDGLEKLADEPNDDVRAFCEENGFDLNTAEGKRAFVEACTTWYIAKGNQKFNANGTPMMASVRFTKEDKMLVIEQRGAELIQNPDFRAQLIERVGDENATDEQLIAAITVDDIENPVTEAFDGSKTATTGMATGVGCLLNFTDTNIWSTLKADLGDAKTKKNRIFKVLLDEKTTTTVHDGYKAIDIVAYPIEFVEDVDVMVRASQN